MQMFYQGKASKKSDFYYFGVWPPPRKQKKNLGDTRPFFSTFWKKCFAPMKAEKNLEKFSKFDKNELKAVNFQLPSPMR